MDMHTRQTNFRIGVLFAVYGGLCLPARGDIIHDLAYGLGYVGFDLRGTHSVLSDGTELLITNTFVGNELDFGPWDLTLQGPLSMALSTGGRGMTEWEWSFRTAPDAFSAATPLNYLLHYDVGGQQAQISGELLLDANVTFNSFGFYDLEVRYSSRQTVDTEGRYSNEQTNFDSDLGPINIRGNIAADVLAILTEPFFEAAGSTNPFASLSGRSQLEKILETGLVPTSGLDSIDAEVARQAASALEDQLLAGALGQVLPFPSDGSAPYSAATRAVPEPAVLLLLLMGVPVLFRRASRKAHSADRNKGNPLDAAIVLPQSSGRAAPFVRTGASLLSPD